MADNSFKVRTLRLNVELPYGVLILHCYHKTITLYRDFKQNMTFSTPTVVQSWL